MELINSELQSSVYQAGRDTTPIICMYLSTANPPPLKDPFVVAVINDFWKTFIALLLCFFTKLSLESSFCNNSCHVSLLFKMNIPGVSWHNLHTISPSFHNSHTGHSLSCTPCSPQTGGDLRSSSWILYFLSHPAFFEMQY